MNILTSAVATQFTHRRSLLVKTFGLAGLSAGVALGALGVVNTPASTVPNASSGDAPTNTVYISPTLNGMTLGATQTWTPPGTVEETGLAAPPVKASPYGQ